MRFTQPLLEGIGLTLSSHVAVASIISKYTMVNILSSNALRGSVYQEARVFHGSSCSSNSVKSSRSPNSMISRVLKGNASNDSSTSIL